MAVFAATTKCYGENVKKLWSSKFIARSGTPMDLLS